MKITYMGRQLNGRFDSLKARIKRFFKKVFVVSFCGLALYGAYQLGEFDKTVYAKPEPDRLETKIGELKNGLLDTLKTCESGGHKESDAIIIFDSNNKASIGEYMFQKTTVQHYYKKLYGKDITSKEAVLIALDSSRARELAHDIIFGEDNGHRNWLNCSNKHNFTATLKIIKLLND